MRIILFLLFHRCFGTETDFNRLGNHFTYRVNFIDKQNTKWITYLSFTLSIDIYRVDVFVDIRIWTTNFLPTRADCPDLWQISHKLVWKYCTKICTSKESCNFPHVTDCTEVCSNRTVVASKMNHHMTWTGWQPPPMLCLSLFVGQLFITQNKLCILKVKGIYDSQKDSEYEKFIVAQMPLKWSGVVSVYAIDSLNGKCQAKNYGARSFT